MTIDTSLQATNGSLKDTSSLLVSVRDLAGRIDKTLEGAESPANNLDALRVCPPPDLSRGSICDGRVTAGAHGIYQRVAIANVPLSGAQLDTTNITSVGIGDGSAAYLRFGVKPNSVGGGRLTARGAVAPPGFALSILRTK